MKRSHRPIISASVIVMAAFAALAAGCGGGASPHVARVTSSTTAATTAAHGAVAFTGCMRSNGVSRFPDPPPVGSQSPKPNLQQLGVSYPQFRAAVRACDHFLPHGGESEQSAQQARKQLADNELSFAKCMRSHGVARFPDPTAQAQLTLEMVQAQGINVHSPAVLHVVQVCLPASHGWLTAAKVRAAINNAGR